jgi:anti-sigma regulatory factor (Ser/Thr protein kinase)
VAQLKVVITKNLVETVPLTGPVVVGRGEDADIPVLDAAVSRRHARIVPDGDGWVLEDMGSANGTFLDDQRTTRAALTDGAVIRLGSKLLVFTAEVPGEQTGSMLDYRPGTPDAAAITDALDSDVVRFIFPSVEGAVEPGMEVARTLIARGPLSPGEADALLTATREAVTNGMQHGNGGDPAREVVLRVAVDGEKVRCTVQDQGEGFDYRHSLEAGRTRHAMDLARERYESGGVGGLGIMLMLRSVDLVEYNAAGNCVTLTKWRGDFYRDETIYGSLGLFAEADEPTAPPTPAAPPGPRHQTVQFEPKGPGNARRAPRIDLDVKQDTVGLPSPDAPDAPAD